MPTDDAEAILLLRRNPLMQHIITDIDNNINDGSCASIIFILSCLEKLYLSIKHIVKIEIQNKIREAPTQAAFTLGLVLIK